MSPANQLFESLAALRRQWRQRVILESAVWIAAAVLLAVIAGTLITTFLGASTATVVAMRILGYALIVVAIVRWMVLPLSRRMTEERFALYVEERAPELKQALLSAVHELRAPEALRASPSLTARLVERTLAIVRPLQRDMVIERPRMLKAARSLGIVAVAGLLLFFAGPSTVRKTAKLLFAPWSIAEAATPVFMVNVLPGNAAIPRGAAVDIKARLDGFSAEGAELVFRNDSSSEWVRLPMSRDSVAGAFTSRMFDLTKATEYFVDANGVRSPTFRLSITEMPALRSVSVDLRYPSYTGLAAEHIDDGGDVAALIGTTVTVHANITRPAQSGTLAFDNGTTVPLAIGKDGTLAASFKVKTTGFYRIDLVAPDGAKVPGSVQFAVDALPDRAPKVFIDEPGRDTKVATIEEVGVAIRASDDYGVDKLELRYRVNGGDEKSVMLADSGKNHGREPRAVHTFFLEEFKLKPGDLIAYHAIAKDGAGNIGMSDVYFLEVRAFGKNYRQSEEQGGGGGGGGGGGDSPDALNERQKEIVAGTFNWLRDSAVTPARKRREDVTTLNIGEGRLREDVASLSARMKQRGVAKTDSTFGAIQNELDSAVVALKAAEERLVKAEGTAALSPEQKALQHLQRAEELYRDVNVQMGGRQGGGGGGGGGSKKKAEDLADLFELQVDKLKNQYEAVQQSSEQSAQREVDASLERLKQLASRQQQENERAQKLAQALSEKLGKDQSGGGGGGGGSQRDLAKQAEEEARRLERLAREQKSPEMSEAAQRMQQAADAMKKAATGSSAQGSAALDELKRAASGVENARSNAVSAAVKKLADQAKDLQDRERDIADGVKGLGSATGDARAKQVQELGAKKDQLSKDVEKLTADADRLSREGQREQPTAAGKIGEAANAIREQRVKDKIDFSKNVIRGGSPDYANAFENQIGDNLKDIADKTREAAGALGNGSATQNQEKALDRARELVRGLESLRERAGDKPGQNGQGKSGQQMAQNGQQGRSGQQGQQGKSGQQGQGQQGQGQQGRGQQGEGQKGGGGGVGNPRNGDAQFGGNGTPGNRTDVGDPRQLSRELGMRRANAEELRKDLVRQGVEVKDLDQAIDEMKRLETQRGLGDPKSLAALQSSVIEGLKNFEFTLYRKLGLGADKTPALGARVPVPAEYRADVEEYYRSLAGAKKKQ
jgi:hypothetical protein